jgi:ribonuclease-3
MKSIIHLLEEMKIEYKELSIYQTAFTHPSYANEHKRANVEDNQRLEFLGDSVLDLVIAEYLFDKNKKMNEGKMTKLRAKYVCEPALSSFALHLSFDEYIRLGQGEINNHGNQKPAILSDCFEAFIGALYIDLGYRNAKAFILDNIVPRIESGDFDDSKDYKSSLQELVQSDKRSIEYEVISSTGPAHKREFTSIVKMDSITLGQGVGSSKKESEQNAAKAALEKMAK